MIVGNMTGKPSFWEWLRYLVNDWEHDDDLDEIIAFAIRMAAWSSDGREVYPSTHKLAKLAGVSIRTAKRRKAKAVELGMFRPIGGHKRGIPKLEIALPPHRRGDNPNTPRVSDLTPDTYINHTDIHIVKGVIADTPNLATGKSEATKQESSGGANPDTPEEIRVVDDPWAVVQ